MSTKRITNLALFTAVALVIHIIENALPPLLPLAPGAKMGLANVAALIALVILGYSDAFIIQISRCLLGALFSGNISSLIYSVPAGLISLFAETLMLKFLFPHIKLTGISFTGAAVFNIVQLAAASLITQTNLFALTPLMLFYSLPAGFFTSAAAYFTIKYLPSSVYLTSGQKTGITNDKHKNGEKNV